MILVILRPHPGDTAWSTAGWLVYFFFVGVYSYHRYSLVQSNSVVRNPAKYAHTLEKIMDSRIYSPWRNKSYIYIGMCLNCNLAFMWLGKTVFGGMFLMLGAMAAGYHNFLEATGLHHFIDAFGYS
ncbi:MAG: hypothetical protein H6849_01965 [Alphaproteobacteria bacterium]|nr:MAG: hypothetical protein H6849_01965 [Alphaproteobacteria bacterium]